jgi:hypothetical protein
MGKLLLGLALVAVLAGCASDSGNQGTAGSENGVSSGSDTTLPNQRNTAPNINSRNMSTESRAH